MARGEIKAGKSAIIGACGEYFVMAELLKRKWLAGLTPPGAPDFDIVATKSGQTIHVRVKTKTENSNVFRWNRRKDGKVFRAPIMDNDFCVLVDIGGAAPRYYVMPTKEVESQLQKSLAKWAAGKAGRNPNNRVMAFDIRHDRSLLSNFESWDVLRSSFTHCPATESE